MSANVTDLLDLRDFPNARVVRTASPIHAADLRPGISYTGSEGARRQPGADTRLPASAYL